MRPCALHSLPLRSLDWERFVDLLGKAHATLARFSLLTASGKPEFFQKRELAAQIPSERKRYQKTLLFSSQAIHKKNLSLTLLRQMHKLLREEEGGRFRTKQNWIGPKGCKKKEAYFLPPPFSTVKKGMENLQAYSRKKEKDPLVQLALYFAQLLIIHPFMDANGRLARAAIPLFLYKKGVVAAPSFYLSAYFRKNRLAYFEKLYLISLANDWEGWIRFFLEAIIEEGEKVIRLYRLSRPFSSSF